MDINKQTYVLFILFPLFISCCNYDEENKRHVCKTLIDIALKGNAEMTNLLFDIRRPLHLTENTFESMPNLEKLTIQSDNTDRSNIDDGAFNGLNQLKQLNIYNLYIPQISLNLQDNLPIQNLTLVNVTERILPGFFDKLPEIFLINITQNTIKTIEPGIFNNTPIHYLFLNNNGIERIERIAFLNLSNLIKLTLSFNKIQRFETYPLGFGGSKLRELWLDHNNIEYLEQSTFAALQSLQFLTLSFNKMKSVEYSALTAFKLGFLDLSNNLLPEFIYNSFPGGLKWLDTLLLHNNKLNHLIFPTHLNLQNLRRISLGGNPFQCPCLEEIEDWLTKRNIGRICDDEYTAGRRPACVYTHKKGLDMHACINITSEQYTEELRTDIEEVFKEALKDYPKLKECDAAKGYY